MVAVCLCHAASAVVITYEALGEVCVVYCDNVHTIKVSRQ